jgi:hypothetical protein
MWRLVAERTIVVTGSLGSGSTAKGVAMATGIVGPADRSSVSKQGSRSVKNMAIAITAGVFVLGAFSGTGAVAAPPDSGCTNGNDNVTEHGTLLLAVADLAPLGYLLPTRLDDPANGGNGDGFVCGVARGNQTTPFGGQIYGFVDNQFFPGPE